MTAELQRWLAESGIATDFRLTELQRGLGANEIWKLETGANEPLVVRLFAPGHQAAANREAAAMQAAHAAGVPAPEVISQGSMATRPVLVTTFAPGELAADALLANPAIATELGVAFGQTMARLHQVTAPDLGRTPGAWIELGGDAIAPLRPLLTTIPDQDRLLHLDFHPRNVLVQDSEVSGVIDWENAHAGPPHADLARTTAILRVMEMASLIPPAAISVLRTFTSSLTESHDAIVGPAPFTGALSAWGLAMTARDLANQVGKPGSPFTSDLISRLESERDAAITTALNLA